MRAEGSAVASWRVANAAAVFFCRRRQKRAHLHLRCCCLSRAGAGVRSYAIAQRLPKEAEMREQRARQREKRYGDATSVCVTVMPAARPRCRSPRSIYARWRRKRLPAVAEGAVAPP